MQKNNIKSTDKVQEQLSHRSRSSRPYINFDKFELLPSEEAVCLLHNPALQEIYNYYRGFRNDDLNIESYAGYYEKKYSDNRVLCEIYSDIRNFFYNRVDEIDSAMMEIVSGSEPRTKGLDTFLSSLLYSIDIFPIAEEILMQYKDYIKEHGGA